MYESLHPILNSFEVEQSNSEWDHPPRRLAHQQRQILEMKNHELVILAVCPKDSNTKKIHISECFIQNTKFINNLNECLQRQYPLRI